MREVGKSLDIDLYVFGPETHMTAIVAMALGEHTFYFVEQTGL
jgi:ATP citrate (pro-S)-lyase